MIVVGAILKTTNIGPWLTRVMYASCRITIMVECINLGFHSDQDGGRASLHAKGSSIDASALTNLSETMYA